jgi:large subunit ribosomal protein L20
MSYNRFIAGLRQAGIDLDRKLLADLAIRDDRAFGELVAAARSASEPAPGVSA